MALVLVLAGWDQGVDGRANTFTRTGEVIAYSGGEGGVGHACFACHGFKGEGNGHDAPRLAGLDQGYLYRQLNDYGDGRRLHDVMGRIADALSLDDRGKVAAYYGGLVAPSRDGFAPSSRAGQELYQGGDAARGLMPCASCHGENGEGQGAANPPLASQPAYYLAEQLRAWKRGERQNDPGHVMQRIAQALSEAEMAAVSAYASGLSGIFPRSESAAWLPARHGGPRNDALVLPQHAPESRATRAR